MEVVCVVLLAVAAATAREYTDEELSSFPKLFHLDDYEKCLAAKDGLYCLGSFDLIPDDQNNPTYKLLKEYSDESHRHFNRTRIHRGYCVSSRCPQEALGTVTQRFERCANQGNRAQTLRASLNTLHYCHTHADKYAKRPTTHAQHLFLQCVFAILAINIIATVYDVYTGNKVEKNKLISAFSIPVNWQSLTSVPEPDDPRLARLLPINGIRAMAMIGTTYIHANVFHYGFYVTNPEYLEKLSQRIDGVLMFDGTSVMQILMTMSCFFTSYCILLYSEKRPVNVFMLPLLIIKRVIRIAPVSLLVIGFSATWWIYVRDGPLAPVSIHAESQVCQTKFWSHAFFINNIVNPTEFCMTPTWYLPVDMHMYIIACTFTLIMWRYRSAALKLYAVLFLVSCVGVAVVAYINEYKSIIYITTPENLRTTLRGIPSFTEFYTSSWGALPSCFLGLLLASIQFELDERKIKLSEYKWFVYLYYCSYVFFAIWPFTGVLALQNRSRVFYAIYVLLDRPVHCILACITMLGLTHVDGPLRKFYNWSGWTRLSNLSLSILCVHWCVNVAIAARPVAYNTSELDMLVDWISTYVITCVLAVPVTLLVEIPAQKFFRQLLF